MNNPDPNVIVEALRYYAESCSSRDVADGALPHAEAIAKMWVEAMTRPTLDAYATLVADYETLERDSDECCHVEPEDSRVHELIAAAMEHIEWHGSAGHERLCAALKNLESA